MKVPVLLRAAFPVPVAAGLAAATAGAGISNAG